MIKRGIYPLLWSVVFNPSTRKCYDAVIQIWAYRSIITYSTHQRVKLHVR
jgi:hypothetical protein